MSSWFSSGSSSSSDSGSDSSSWSSSGSSYGDDFSSSSMSSSSDMSPGLSGGSGMSGLQQAIMEEQQRQQIQEAVMKIADIAFQKCVTRPSSSLGSSEKSCIKNTTERYLDTSMFVTNRIIKQQQQR